MIDAVFMSRFEDVEQFVRDHRACGTLTPITSSPGRGGYLLILSCSCGQQFQRWVTAEEAETGSLPGAPPSAAGQDLPSEPAPIDISAAATESQSLQDVMQQALEAIDTPKTAAPAQPTPPAAPASPLRIFMAPPAPDTPAAPPTAPSAAPTPVAPRPATTPAVPPPPARADSTKASAPTPPSVRPPAAPAKPATRPTPPAARPTPAAAAQSRTPESQAEAARAARREAVVPKPDRSSLEEALRSTLKALGDDDSTTATAGSAPSDGRQILDLDAQPGVPTGTALPDTTPGGRLPPDKEALQSALRATLDALQAEGTPGQRGRGAPGIGGELADTPPPRKGLSITTVLAAIVVLLAAVGGGYGLRVLGQRQAEIDAAAARAVVHLRIVEHERAAVAEGLTALRALQDMSHVETPYRVYFNKVAFTKTDVERSLQSVKDTATRTAVTEALSLHVLAAAAWRAKTLNERERWETVGDDPLADLCLSTRRLLAVSEDPANMSRAQWRGMTLAAGVPLLWDCAADRLAALERGLNAKAR
jgi:hypothetical protein